jgi:ferric-dicitrate binding protein FerR (iron transport regulator)
MSFSNEDRILELLGKKLSGNITLPERLELSELIKNEPHKERLGNIVEEFFLNKRIFDIDQLPVSSKQRVYSAVLDKISKKDPQAKKEKTFSLYKIGAAAAVILFVSLLFLFNRKDGAVPVKTHPITASTKKGGKSNLVLPDGTKVWLNNDTRITYDESFGKKDRSVTLVGEAYFEVTHDATRPFLVHTEQADVKVLGTTFNVRSYMNEPIFETSLVTGKVEVTMKNKTHKKIELVPNEKLTIVNNNPNASVATATEPKIKNEENFSLMQVQPLSVQNNTVIETSWINDQLAFHNKSLEDIAKDLERSFNIQVIFRNKEVMKYRFTGIYDNSDLGKIMRIMKLSNPFEYHITGDRLIIE